MKNEHSILCVMLFIFGIFSSIANAQILTGINAATKVRGASEIRLDQTGQTISYIKMKDSEIINESDHMMWLTKEVLKVDNNTDFSDIRKEKDNFGFTHYRYTQKYHGLKVEYGTYYVHIKNSKVESANGEFYAGIKISPQPTFSKENALKIALIEIQSSKLNDDNKGTSEILKTAELLILPYKNNYHLAYRFDVYSLTPLKRVYIYIDAFSGKKITEVNRIHTSDSHGNAVTAYNGNVTMTTDSLSPNNYRLTMLKGFSGIRTLNMNNGSSYGSATNFTDNNNVWDVSNIDKYATDAHFGSEATYDWYFSRFGRNSFDNAGIQINTYVHYGSNFVNAFWDGTAFTFGDGDGMTYTPLTSLDIVGHEITHAVTERTAGLIYSGESGAINEAYSDCFGVTVDFYKNPTTANFLEGDQINVNGIPFRNMGNPNQYSDPDTYNGDFWSAGGDVHSNSGVMNFWYYLICTGGSGVNDLGHAYTVNSIGMTKASEIAYRTLTVYLTPSSNYSSMRYYSIQAATDLYGNCSEEVIQITNAWYAVGVGGIFSNAVVAGFSTSQNIFCVVPATANFINTSFNGTSFSWTFGDGGTSTLAAPSHTYSSAGVYSIRLIANGTGSCTSVDTSIQTNYITVTNGGGPISASCNPSTISACCGAGITNVNFNTINHSSSISTEGYKDFTCGNATTIIAGEHIPITITTGTSGSENVKAWIDYNNDGIFNSITEQVFSSNNIYTNHTGIVNTKSTAVLNSSLRMRITDDNSSYAITDGCYNSNNGQTEDYTITFIANTLPPVADFSANNLSINVGGTVNFSDLSLHIPTSWHWTFTGATVLTSTLQNPSSTYNTVGIYSATLRVTNSFGTDSLVKTAYIHVVNSVNMCSGFTSTNALNGQLYDSGGPTGYYSNNENCSLLIDPVCALSITLSFTQFSSESCCDWLRVYDGTNSSAPLLLTSFGYGAPSPVTATSGKMYIVWYSDQSVSYDGWSASWTSVIGSVIPPVAAFTTSTNNPPLGTNVQFTDHTTNTPFIWTWDFGDGNSSTSQNPLHSYNNAGNFTTRLIAGNCITSDTVTHLVTVQSAPIIFINPDTIQQTLNCNDSIVIPVTITNTGTGDLVYHIEGSSLYNDTVEILAFVTGVDSLWEYSNTLVAINTYFTKYHVTKFYSTNASELQLALVGKNVLLFPEQEYGSSTFYSAIGTTVQSFASNGGNVIVLGSGAGFENRMYDMGLFTGSYISNNTGNIIVLDTTDDLTDQCPLSFYSPSATSSHNILNSDKIKLASLYSYDIFTYRNIGLGKVIYCGFDYYEIASTTARMISNCVKAFTFQLQNWIHLPPTTDTLSPGSSTIIYITLSSATLNAGSYFSRLAINSNDPLRLTANIDFDLTVEGPAIIALSDTCITFGAITQHTNKTDTIQVYNNGCDTLDLTSITSNVTVFSPTSSTMHVAPGKFGNLLVTFQPQTIGTFNGILTIRNNSNDTTICLSGISGAAPEIVFSPSGLSAILNACSDSVTLPLYVKNHGGIDLTFLTGGSNSITPVHVLAFAYGADMSSEYPNTINAINRYFTNYTLDTTLTRNASILETQLEDIDVLLFPEQESGYADFYSSFSSVVQNFISEGGTVIVCGSETSISGLRIYDMGLFTGSFSNISSSGYANVLDTTDDIMDGIPLSIPLSNLSFYHNFTNSDKIELASYNGSDFISYRRIGSGKAIYLPWDFYEYNNYTQKIISNCIKYANHNSLPPWISISPLSGTVSPGDSTLVNFTFRTNGISGGVYTGYVFVTSNDPLHLTDSIFVSLTVENNPCARISFQAPSSCSGIVAFRDSSINYPTSWLWDFGDGTTSTQQNPFHNFTSAGTYPVKLKVCNTISCDSTTRNVRIISINGPVAALCAPNTISNCCGMGISSVSFSGIYRISSDGSEGYKDFSCADVATVTQNQSYNLTIQTGESYSENVVAWIDYNSDGIFGTTEIVFTSRNQYRTHSGTITISNSSTVNIPLRMRIGSDYYSNPLPESCTNIENGQFEDYSVLITPNSLPPIAAYTFNAINNCSGQVQFTDNSINNPSSWIWDFGDGSISTIQNPLHHYLSPGNFTVTLTATNNYGISNISKHVRANIISNGITVSGQMVVNEPIRFSTSGTGILTYLWNFGDGYLSNLQFASHTYPTYGTYIISLTVTNASCSVTYSDTLIIIRVGIDKFPDGTSFILYPNPFSEEINISYNLSGNNEVTLQVFDVLGNIVKEPVVKEYQSAGKYTFTLRDLSQSVYFVRFIVNNKNAVYKIIQVH